MLNKKTKIGFLISLLFVSTFLLFIQSKNADAKEKRKVLLLQIIEENWDNLEFIGPKIKRVPGYRPSTKKEVMERKVKEWKEMETKEQVLESVKHYMSTGSIPNDTKLVMFHIIRWLGKIDEFKDNDIFEEKKYRFGETHFRYFYEKIPEKILLLTEPIKTRSLWTIGHLEHIRLLGDIVILSSDNSGNLTIKYDGKTYNLRAGDKIIFPTKVANLTKDEIDRFKDKYRKKIGAKADYYYGSTNIISIKQPKYQFKTKVTIINYGYKEIEL